MQSNVPSEGTHEPHSAQYFGEERDYWWNSDFLELMAKRWELDKVKTVLDVACGVGHWGHLLSKLLPQDARISGIDMEKEWVEICKEKTKGQESRFEYMVGTAENIPFPNASFDMVTCQTVLLHVKDVQVAIKEMLRVLKPGGLLAVVEPNNVCSELVFDTVTVKYPLEDILKAIQFQLICERGTAKLGIGSGSIGDLIPFYFSQSGLQDIKVYLSDKACLICPPYATREQQVYIQQLKDWFKDELLIWNKEDTRKYYLAGGGDEKDFEPTWNLLKKRFQSQINAIEEGNYAHPGSTIFYLISGRKAK